ncbi:hypothetical protein Tco_0942507 [Tanacetum coccineum]
MKLLMKKLEILKINIMFRGGLLGLKAFLKLLLGSETREEESSKRAGDELEQENAKKQKVDDDQETAELQQCDWKIIKERKIGAIYQIIRANGEIQRVSAAGTKVTTVGVEKLQEEGTPCSCDDCSKTSSSKKDETRSSLKA